MENKEYIVYIHSLSDGRAYIGQTKNSLEKRAGKDGKNYHDSPKFYNAIQKYGWDNFEHKILKSNLSSEEANFWEEKFIKDFNTINNGFNINFGGNNHSHSDETKKKISNTLKGKEFSEEHKKHLSLAKQGEKNNRYGVHLSEETKRKIGEANKISQLGHKHTKETKIKMSESHKQYYVQCIETKKIYHGPTEASMALAGNKNAASHIGEVCRGTRKTALGYHWKRVEIDE